MSSVVARQHAQLRSSGCLWREDGVARLRLEGADAASWLHGQCSQNIKEMAAGRGRAACFLDPLGRVLFAVEVLRSDEAIDLLVASSQAESLLQHLDRFVFTEDLQIRLLSAELQTLWVHVSRRGRLRELSVPCAAARGSSMVRSARVDLAACERHRTGGCRHLRRRGAARAPKRSASGARQGAPSADGDAAARIARLQAGVARPR